MRQTIVALCVASLSLAGCGDKDAGAGSSSASATGSAPAKSAVASTTSAAPAKTEKTPTTKLTGKAVQDAYEAAKKDSSAFDAQLASVKKALGDPQKTDGDASIWWGWAPKEGKMDQDCIELKMSATKGNSVGGTDWGKCGMAN